MRYVSNLRRQTGGEPLTGKPQRLQRFDGASCAGEARAGMRHARSHIIYVHLHPVWLAAAITHTCLRDLPSILTIESLLNGLSLSAWTWQIARMTGQQRASRQQ